MGGGPIRGQYTSHVICLDQSEARREGSCGEQRGGRTGCGVWERLGERDSNHRVKSALWENRLILPACFLEAFSSIPDGSRGFPK